MYIYSRVAIVLILRGHGIERTQVFCRGLTPNYALERSVRGLSVRAAGAQNIIAPAARTPGCARTAQRGR
jgi:hypothetical protein